MKVIITGSTGMVGKGVLIECLKNNHVEAVLVINRKPIDIKHSKLTEILLNDFTQIESVKEQLTGYNACFYCMGISSVGMNESDFYGLTFSLTETLAKILHEQNPDIVFNYVSGTGTDSTEKGKVMWARVKGKTENLVLKMGFKDAYAFRPGIILPENGVKSKTGWYNAIYVITKPLFPILRKMKSVTTSSKVGLAMINSVLFPQNLKHLENKDINELASRT